ncbi:MAG: polyprenyl synthetase family protein [Hydrogenoanaerobacterium sp.]
MQNYNDKQKQYINDIELALEKYLQQTDEPYKSVTDAMRYSVLGGGKRVRAVLLLEFCKACGGTQELAMPFACALEMLHAYSLVHDDLPCMDGDEMRRGKPSCWKKYGETTALLAGDGLLTKAFEVCAGSSAPPQNALRATFELAKNAGECGMLGGQVIDLLSENKKISEKLLLQIYRQKTGALLRSAAKIGCILAGASEDKILLAEEYADKTGLAFQIVDDILDIAGDEKNKKTTFVSLHGLENAKNTVYSLTNEAKSIISKFDFSDEFLYNMMDSLAVRQN